MGRCQGWLVPVACGVRGPKSEVENGSWRNGLGEDGEWVVLAVGCHGEVLVGFWTGLRDLVREGIAREQWKG